jgi:hypothetical protein
MSVLLGIAALSIDACFMFDKRNKLYAAADAAAKTGAMEVQRNPSISNGVLQTFAYQQVVTHGFNPYTTTSVVINHPPASGTYAGNPGYVEAIVSEQTSTMFGVILGITSMTPTARAVAGVGNPLNCFVTTGTGPSGYSLELDNAQFDLNNCGAAVGGNLDIDQNPAYIHGTPPPPVGVAGTCNPPYCDAAHTGGAMVTGAAAPTDPLAGLAAPTNPGGCVPSGGATSLTAGCYTSITVPGNTTVTLSPGIYYVTGGINFTGNHATLTGTGVLIYLTGTGGLNVNQNSTIQLTAMTSGPYEGIAIFQDPSNPANWGTGNSFVVDVTGAIYMPSMDVVIPNAVTFASTTCTVFIAHSLQIKAGSGSFTTTGCNGLFGSAAYLSVSIAE